MQITMQTKPVSVFISAFTHSSGGRNPTSCGNAGRHVPDKAWSRKNSLTAQPEDDVQPTGGGGGWFNEAAGGENPQLSWRPCDRSQVHLYQGTCGS